MHFRILHVNRMPLHRDQLHVSPCSQWRPKCTICLYASSRICAPAFPRRHQSTPARKRLMPRRGNCKAPKRHSVIWRHPTRISSPPLFSPESIASALPGEMESFRRKGIAPGQSFRSCPCRQTASQPGSGPGQAFGGTCSNRLLKNSQISLGF